MRERTSGIEMSVIVPVGSRHADARELHAEYKAGLDALAAGGAIADRADRAAAHA